MEIGENVMWALSSKDDDDCCSRIAYSGFGVKYWFSCACWIRGR